MRTLIYIFSFLLLLSSCTDIVELELPEPKVQLVVNSTFTPDSAWTVEVSTSQSSLNSKPYEMVTDAVVEVYQGEQRILQLPHMGNGKYKSGNVLPLAQEQYTLKVSAPGLPACHATDFVPALPLISGIKAAASSNLKDPEIPEVEVTFTLEDVANTANYYYINAYIQDTSHTGEAYKNYVSIGFISPFEAEFSIGNRYFFSDKFMEGQIIPIKLRYERPAKGKVLLLNIVQISPDYYNYSKTLEKQSYRDNFLTTPGPVYNNIRNGFGIFAGYNTRTIRIRH